MHDHIEDHDRGLAHDLQIISAQLIERRRALAWLAGGGSALVLAGCGGGDSSDTASTTTSTGTTTATTTSATSSTGSTTSSTSSGTTTSGTCIADPSETSGPYPADGTNTSSGSTSNVLTASGIVRSDIRTSFLTSTTTAEGVQLSLTLTLVNASNGCTPLAGYAIYLWHCDRAGNYSLYSGAATESYLRGVQVTDANGQVTFTTIFPACYSGRWPHIHFEVFASTSAATSGRAALLTSQLAMPSDICTTVYNGATGYSASVTNLARVSLSSDYVFGDNSSAQIAQQTPSMTGSVSAGYTATNTIGIAI